MIKSIIKDIIKPLKYHVASLKETYKLVCGDYYIHREDGDPACVFIIRKCSEHQTDDWWINADPCFGSIICAIFVDGDYFEIGNAHEHHDGPNEATFLSYCRSTKYSTEAAVKFHLGDPDLFNKVRKYLWHSQNEENLFEHCPF